MSNNASALLPLADTSSGVTTRVSPQKTEEAKLPTFQYIRLQNCQSVEFTT